MLKVKANWKVGYPAGPDKKVYSEGDIFKCDDEWGKKKAEQGKVEVVEEIKEEKKEPAIKITDLTVDEAEKVINECEDIEQLKDWLHEENKNKQRKTAMEYLTDRIAELKE